MTPALPKRRFGIGGREDVNIQVAGGQPFLEGPADPVFIIDNQDIHNARASCLGLAQG